MILPVSFDFQSSFIHRHASLTPNTRAHSRSCWSLRPGWCHSLRHPHRYCHAFCHCLRLFCYRLRCRLQRKRLYSRYRLRLASADPERCRRHGCRVRCHCHGYRRCFRIVDHGHDDDVAGGDNGRVSTESHVGIFHFDAGTTLFRIYTIPLF